MPTWQPVIRPSEVAGILSKQPVVGITDSFTNSNTSKKIHKFNLAEMAGTPLWWVLLAAFSLSATTNGSVTRVCIVGAGIAGSSLAHFLRDYGGPTVNDIVILEKNPVVGGRTMTVNLSGDSFEAGASVIHPRNSHVRNFTSLLGLRARPGEESSMGVWNGSSFVFRTLQRPDKYSGNFVFKRTYSLINSLRILYRYGFSLLRMQRFVKRTVDKFMRYYVGLGSRPIFESPEAMLKWTGLYRLTQQSLRNALADAGLSPLLISELITVITRINYGQSVDMSGLAGAVGLAGSDSGLWAVDGGNRQLTVGLIERSNATLILTEEIMTIRHENSKYELRSKGGNQYTCHAVAIAAPLDEIDITFDPPIKIPQRRMQHTHTTFVRGLLDPAYFGLDSESDIPHLVGTMEIPEIPFSSISVLKSYKQQGDKAYKIFSRSPMNDDLLNQIFRVRTETVRIDWAAYPHYSAPEDFAPFILDGSHLYYVNSFESAASTMETSVVAAENIARLILSRLSHDNNYGDVVRASSRSTQPYVEL